jgi:Alpha/beta hydrolase family
VLAAIVAVDTGMGPTANAPPTLAEACGSAPGLRAQPLWLTTPDGVRLYAIEAGRGSATIVLAHPGGEDLCGWLLYMATLVRAGVRVLAFDFRGWGHSDRPTRNPLALGDDQEAAVAHARAAGAGHVFLLGASMGGAAVVQNTAGLPVDGRISLSGTRLWRGYGINDAKGVRSLREPFLYIGTRHDSRAPVGEARAVFRSVGSPEKRAVFYPGSLHGRHLVEDAPFAGRARALILGWIRSHS